MGTLKPGNYFVTRKYGEADEFELIMRRFSNVLARESKADVLESLRDKCLFIPPIFHHFCQSENFSCQELAKNTFQASYINR